MNKIIVLVGIQCSGKSTYAKKISIDPNNKTVRVNRDDIRKMLGKYWIPNRENLVTNIENDIIERALNAKYNVVIDATNIGPNARKRWNKFVEDYLNTHNENIEIEYIYFPISLFKALWRNFWRNLILPKDQKIKSKVIKDFYKRYIKEYE